MKKIYAAGLLIPSLLYYCSAFAAPTCSVTAVPLNFGTYDPFSSTRVIVNGTITIVCQGSPPANYTATLSTGGSGTYTNRKMVNGLANLNYNLYTDAAATLIWGDGSLGTQIISHVCTNPNPNTCTIPYPVYGAIQTLQTNAAVGTYQDTITVTVNF